MGYKQNYFDYFGYKEGDFIACEVCGATAVDIHHIKARGMGGSKERFINQVENLMALCRKCHVQYGDKWQHMEFLKDRHRRVLLSSNHDNEREILFP